MELILIQHKIYEIRGLKVLLDFDLAYLYKTETRTLKQAVKRNINRFPTNFMFQLAKKRMERAYHKK
ncbi:MAG: ORF6N domain-containing protein [Chitinophagaceae bacterium]